MLLLLLITGAIKRLCLVLLTRDIIWTTRKCIFGLYLKHSQIRQSNMERWSDIKREYLLHTDVRIFTIVCISDILEIKHIQFAVLPSDSLLSYLWCLMGCQTLLCVKVHTLIWIKIRQSYHYDGNIYICKDGRFIEIRPRGDISPVMKSEWWF